MALSASRNTERYGEIVAIDSFPVGAAKKIYAGGLVAVAKSGAITPYAEAASDAASKVCKGVAVEDVDNTDGDAGDLNVDVQYGDFEFTSSGLSASYEGSPAYVYNDGEVRLKGATTYDIGAGIITKVLSATSARVRITPESIAYANSFGS
jgi:hypothetical protein